MTSRAAIALFALALLLAAAPASAASPGSSPAPAVPKDGKCRADSTFIADIKGVELAVPRTARFRLTLDDGITKIAPNRPGPGYDCDTPRLAVRGLATSGYTIGTPAGSHGSKGNSPEARFNAARNAVIGAPRLRGSHTEKLPNGILKITAPLAGAEYFQLPTDVAPTADGFPVTFHCDNSEPAALAKIIPRLCSTAYLHPSGLPFSYDILRTDYPGDDFIAADREKRKLLDDMLGAAKAKK